MKNQLFITALAILIVLSTQAEVLAEDKNGLQPGKWPTTVESTVSDILLSMTEENRQTIKTTKKEDLIMFHHGWGTGIRNHYGLWRGNKELLESACGKPCHPDDASMIIIEAVWNKLQQN